MSKLARVTAVVVAAALPAVAAAQSAAPPSPALSRTTPAWMGYAFMVILLGMVLGVSLMPSKRGHQD